jgi:hypothetical protein
MINYVCNYYNIYTLYVISTKIIVKNITATYIISDGYSIPIIIYIHLYRYTIYIYPKIHLIMRTSYMIIRYIYTNIYIYILHLINIYLMYITLYYIY